MDFKKKMKKFFTMTRKADGGFTLVELIVVIAILAILAGVAVPAYGGYVEKAKMAADQQLLATMNTAFTVACMDNGEYDMTNLSFSPKATGLQTAVQVNNQVNTAFQGYFGGGVFQYFNDGDVTFNKAKGMFVYRSVAAIKEAVKAALEESNFNDEAVLETLMETFDTIGSYFAGDETHEGFSLDGLLANAPQAVQDKFNFGTFDMSDAEILQKYDSNYANKSLEEIQTEIDAGKVDAATLRTLKGNAYVLRFAEEAKGKDAGKVLADVTELMGAIGSVTEKTYKDYYKAYINPDGAPDNWGVEDLVDEIELAGGLVPAPIVAGVGMSNVYNDSGVTTLGSMYALAAGFYNSSYYSSEMGTKPNDFSSFDAVQSAMVAGGGTAFQNYLNSEQSVKDVDAYLSAMEYISTGSFDMNNNSLFAGSGLDLLLGALSSGN